MCDRQPIFGAFAWNSSAITLSEGTVQEQEYFNRLGEIIYGVGAEFRADIKFYAMQPGFIVQEIWRELNVEGEPIDAELFAGSHPLLPNIHYWEIFYVDEKEGIIFLSQVADSYLLGSEEANYPRGNYKIRGVSTFYPLPDGLVINYDQTGDKQNSTETIDTLKRIFGNHVKFDGEAELGFIHAGGLPVSTEYAPLMNKLNHSYYQLVRNVECSWSPERDSHVRESFYYQVYENSQITCPMFVLPRYELLPDPDTREKQKERVALTTKFREYLDQPKSKRITNATSNEFIEKMISSNYNPSQKKNSSGGKRKKQTKRNNVKRNRTKRRNKKKKQKVYIKIG